VSVWHGVTVKRNCKVPRLHKVAAQPHVDGVKEVGAGGEAMAGRQHQACSISIACTLQRTNTKISEA
jgi:hypothetical protein